ncbi:MAG: DVUA0089 family protein [Spirochaetaceae bacterium]|jgi:hypothetical protein|nr:DVUA0089 family protein [Spirochaetaceae bacterium]
MTNRIWLAAALGVAVHLGVFAQPAVEIDPNTASTGSIASPAPVSPGRTNNAVQPDTAQPGANQPGQIPQNPAQTNPSGTNVQLRTDPDGAPLTLQNQQSAEVNSLAELDAESRKLGDWIKQGLATLPANAKIRLGQFLLNGNETDLGAYWRNQLSSVLSSMQDRKFVILTDPNAQTDYTLTGEIMRIGNTLRLYTRLTRTADSALITTWALDLALTPFIESLIGGPQSGSSGSSSSVRPDAYEPDSRQNPLKTDPNGPEIQRTLHDNDEDWFEIQTPENGTLTLETTGSMDTFIELYDGSSPNSSRIANDDDGGDRLNARIEYFAEAGKTYLAKVRGLGGDTGSYGFKPGFTPMPPDSTEPNNDRETATTIELNAPVSGSFQSSDDEDWYVLTIPDGGGYLVVLTEGRMDTIITVYNAEGAELAEDDDSGSGLNARSSVLVPGGTVYIRVREVDGDRGAYTLRTQVREPGVSDAFEPDDTRETAKAIAPGAEQSRTFTAADDADWAKFTVAEPGVYEIRAYAAEGDLDTYIELYDSEGEFIDDDDDGGDDYDARLRVRLDPGTYFILITTLDDDPLEDNAYTLSVSEEEDEGM